MKYVLPSDEKIAALVPEYSERGDSTRIYLTDGSEELLACTMRTALTRIASRRCKSLRLMREKARRYTQRKLNNPIASSHSLVLTPIKMRRPRVRGDMAMGHVNVAAVTSTAGTRQGTAIELAGGKVLRTSWGAGTVLRHIAEAEHIRMEMVHDLAESFFQEFHIDG